MLHQLPSIGVDVAEEKEECLKWVHEHPRDLVICLGNLAMETVVGHKGIGLYRGSLVVQDKYDVFCMYAPGAIAKDWTLDVICKQDAKKLRRYWEAGPRQFESAKKDLYLYGRHVRRSLRSRQDMDTVKSAEYFLQFIAACKAAGQIFAFDIETFNETITVFGLATSSTRAISIPFTGQFSPFEEATLVEALRDLLDTPVAKITQNGIYDTTLLADVWGVQVRGAVYDTMLMHHCIYSELPHGLAFLASVYSDEPFFKQMAKEANDVNYNLAHWEYNALDCAVTYQSWETLCKELTHFKLWDFYVSHYHPLSRALANIQRRGILLDKEARKTLKDTFEGELATARAKVNEIVGNEFNVNSPKQMKEFVHGTLNLPKQVDRRSQKSSLGQTQLATLRRKFPKHAEFFDAVLTVREKAKLISTYLKPLEDPDGRVRTSYNIAGSAHKADAAGGTETGRLSSSSNAYRRGGNLQNQPKVVRHLYIPDPGWTFWQCDMASAESYVVAWESGDEVMLDVLTNHRLYGKSESRIMYHETIGNIITGLAPKDVVGDIRDLAKRVGHAWNYGMAPGKLVELVNNYMPKMPFTQQNAQSCYNNLNNTLHSVVNWRELKKQQVLRTRTLENCFGRKRIFFGRLDDGTFREAYAFIPQGTVGDALNKVMIRLEDRFDLDIAMVLGQVHDSVMGQCRTEHLDVIREMVIEEFEQPLPMECQGLTLRIPCEFSSGINWYECG
jgi:DNA polymerase-1